MKSNLSTVGTNSPVPAGFSLTDGKFRGTDITGIRSMAISDEVLADLQVRMREIRVLMQNGHLSTIAECTGKDRKDIERMQPRTIFALLRSKLREVIAAAEDRTPPEASDVEINPAQVGVTALIQEHGRAAVKKALDEG